MQNLHESRNTVKNDGADNRNGSSKTFSKTTIPKTRTNTSLKVDHSKDKELINSGLHKLLSTFNTNKAGHNASETHTTKKSAKGSLPELEYRNNSELNSQILLTKQMSIDKYTMTDFEDNEQNLEIESTLLCQPPYRDLQWTDPRLLKKYQLSRQPYKKSLTIPYVNRSDYGSEVIEEVSDEEVEVLCSENKNFLFKCLYHFCTTSVSFIGFMCGITLITVVLWKMLDENLLIFRDPPKSETFIKKIMRGVSNLVVNLVNSVFGKIMRLLTMSTSEVLSQDDEVAASKWYHQFY